MKEIKTKQTRKDIKVLDKTADVSHRAKNAYIRTKEQTEQLRHNEDGNYVDNAVNNVRESAETVVRKAGHITGDYSKKAVEKIKEHRAPYTDAQCSDAPNGEYTQHAPKNEAKEMVRRDVARTETKQAADRNTTLFRAKEAVKQDVSQPTARQTAKQNVVQSRTKETVKRKYTLLKPNELAKRRFVQSRAKQRLTHAGEIRVATQKAVQTQAPQASRRITAQTVQRPLFQPGEKVARQTFNTFGKTSGTIKRSAENGGKTIKAAAKDSVKIAKRTVKTAKHSTKTAIKTSQSAAKATIKTAQSAQRAAQAARAAARATAVSAKTALKAMVVTIKVIIAAAKSLITLIVAGGWIAVIVIIVICLSGLLFGSVFGIFYSNDSSGENTPIMTEVVSQLNNELKVKLEQIQNENPHDTLELSRNGSSTISNWREILAVYAVKAAADPENGMEVATLDDTKVGILRGIFWDMNLIDNWAETTEHKEVVTTTDKDGNETKETVTTTETILHINLTSKSYTDMIAEYGFNEEQVKMLNELMKDEYKQLFMQITGS